MSWVSWINWLFNRGQPEAAVATNPTALLAPQSTARQKNYQYYSQSSAAPAANPIKFASAFEAYLASEADRVLTDVNDRPEAAKLISEVKTVVASLPKQIANAEINIIKQWPDKIDTRLLAYYMEELNRLSDRMTQIFRLYIRGCVAIHNAAMWDVVKTQPGPYELFESGCVEEMNRTFILILYYRVNILFRRAASSDERDEIFHDLVALHERTLAAYRQVFERKYFMIKNKPVISQTSPYYNSWQSVFTNYHYREYVEEYIRTSRATEQTMWDRFRDQAAEFLNQTSAVKIDHFKKYNLSLLYITN